MSDTINLLDESRSAPAADGGESILPNLRAVAVLFLSSGRNAWQSTWISEYIRGDFFREGREVQSVVERRKTRGTVFYLEVRPGFQFCFGSRKFILTEINTLDPFHNMDIDEARYQVMHQNLSGFLDKIAPPSSLWNVGQQEEGHIILQEVARDYIDLAAYAALSSGTDKFYNPPLGHYQRRSAGDGDWYWSETDAPRKISTESYNKALEALMESRERLAEMWSQSTSQRLGLGQ
jgi:hypothetical protein